jgi:hypothetical protein
MDEISNRSFMTPLETVRAAVIKAVPKIAKQEVNSRTGGPHTQKFTGWEPCPIRLADVLVAISEKQNQDGLRFPAKETMTQGIIVSTSGQIGYMVVDKSNSPRLDGETTTWNPRNDYLSAQSEECIEFLADLLT